MMEYVYIGSYGDGNGYGGISIFKWDKERERLLPCGNETRCRNPSYMAVHPYKNILYAANEVADCAIITAHKIDKTQGILEYINMARVPGNGMCHISVLPNGKAVVASNYGSGNLASCALEPSGKLGEAITSFRHGDGGSGTQRKNAHIHQAEAYPDGKKVIAVDLGYDTLKVYDVNEAGVLTEDSDLMVTLENGQGPRHIRFHPFRRFVYVLTELGNRIFLYEYSGKNGLLTFAESYPLVPEGYVEPAYAAELGFSKDARFLYASVRGYDRIIRFCADKENGRLYDPQVFKCYGKYPRMFAFSCDGSHMFIANQKSGTITVVRVDEKSGGLSEPCEIANVPNPCAVLPAVW